MSLNRTQQVCKYTGQGGPLALVAVPGEQSAKVSQMNGSPCVRTQPASVHQGQSQATAQNSLLLEKVRGRSTRVLTGKWELSWPCLLSHLNKFMDK